VFQAGKTATRETSAALIKKGVLTWTLMQRKNAIYRLSGPKNRGSGRTVIEGSHTNIVTLEKNGIVERRADAAGAADNVQSAGKIASLSFKQYPTCRSATEKDAGAFKKELNGTWPSRSRNVPVSQSLREVRSRDPLGVIGQMVFSGVYARMSGANQ